MASERHEPSRSEWREFFDLVTKDHEGDAVTIEIVGLDYGDQFEAERMPFTYIEFDDNDDTLIVGVGGKEGRFPVVLRHIVEHPQTILADPPLPNATRAFDIVSKDGVNSIVTLHPRPPLPPPD